MAKIQQEVLTIKISKLLKDNELEQELVSNDLKAQLEVILKELAGQEVLIEIYQGD
jgi:hypothetical protein